MSNTPEISIKELNEVVNALCAHAAVKQVEQRSVPGGLFIYVDWETSTVRDIEVDRGFLEFFEEHRANVLRCFIVRKVIRHFSPGYNKPSEEDLSELGWPTEWASRHMTMLSTLIT